MSITYDHHCCFPVINFDEGESYQDVREEILVDLAAGKEVYFQVNDDDVILELHEFANSYLTTDEKNEIRKVLAEVVCNRMNQLKQIE